MKSPVPTKVRLEPASSPEVARAKALYFLDLRRRLREGSYLTPLREDLALQRLLQAVREDLPDES